MKQSIKNRIKKFETQSTKVPPGMFVALSCPDLAWQSKKYFELWEEEIRKGVGTPDTYNEFDMKRHFKNAGNIQEKYSIRIKPARPVPACIQEMIHLNS